MRNQNKIVSLVLVVALLLSMIVVFPSASTASQAETEEFSPIGTYVETVDSAALMGALKAPNADNNWGYVGPVNFNKDNDGGKDGGKVPATLGITTNNVTGEKYAEIKPGEKGSNSYIQVTYGTAQSGVDVKKGNTNQYFILDMDLAFFGEVSNALTWYAVCRDSSGGMFATNAGTNATMHAKFNALEKGVFHHFTTILDFDNDTINVFINGELAYSAAKGAHNGNTTRYEAGFKFEQFRLFSSSVDHFAFDNISVRKATDVASTAAALTAGSLANWTENLLDENYEYPTLVPYAKLNGEEVVLYSELTDTLASGALPVNVEFLRDFDQEITVNTDAIINTNGCNVSLKAASGVTVSVNGNVYTYDAPFKSTIESTTSGVNNGYLSANPGILTSGGGLANWEEAGKYDKTVEASMREPAGKDGAYLSLNAIATKTTANHFVNVGFTTTPVNFTNQFYVLEADVATDTAISPNWNFAFVIRGAAGSSKSYDNGTAPLKDLIAADGEWHHITYVADMATNRAYTFVDGVLTGSVRAAYNAANFVENDNVTYSGLRINISSNIEMGIGDNLSIDNLSFNVYNGDASLASAIQASDITVWDKAVTTTGAEALPAYVTVDGVPYSHLDAFSGKLTGNVEKAIEVYRDLPGAVVVNCDAVVNTNGLSADFSEGEGVEVSRDGNIITFNAPFRQSIAYTEAPTGAGVADAVRGSLAGNKFASSMTYFVTGTTSAGAYGNKGYFVDNTVHGNRYFNVMWDSSVTDTRNNNAYLELDSQTVVNQNDTTQFMVYDFDFGLLADTRVGLTTVSRGNDGNSSTTEGDKTNGFVGTWGSVNKPAHDIVKAAKNFQLGKMFHVTMVINIDTNTIYYFVDGAYITQSANGFTSAENYEAYWKKDYPIRLDGLRFDGNTADFSFILDEMNMRYVEVADTTAAGNLAAAMDATNLAMWTDACTTVAAPAAPIATVDGEYVESVAELNAILAKSYEKKTVELLRDEATTITVGCDAVVDTNGLAVTVVAGTDTTVTEDGENLIFDGPFIPSATFVEQTPKTNSDLIANIPGNKVASLGAANWDTSSMTEYLVTPNDGSSPYAQLVAVGNKTTGNHFVGVNQNKETAILDFGGYYVVDMDVATDGNWLEHFTLGLCVRDKDRDSSAYACDGENIEFTSYIPNDGTWHHYTLVGDLAANKLHLFVDGEWVLSGGTAYNASKKTNVETNNPDTIWELVSVRINYGPNVATTPGDSLAYDNVAVRVFGADTEISTAVTNKSLTAWSQAVTAPEAERLPILATVDGVDCYSAAVVDQLLKYGKNHTVYLQRETVGSNARSNSTATVYTNGLANSVIGDIGYTANDNGNGTYSIVVDTRTGAITVKLGDKTVINDVVPYGTDIAEYLYETYAVNTALGYFFDENQVIYTGATWDVAPTGLVSGDVTYNVTGASVFTGNILCVIPAENNVRTSDGNMTDFVYYLTGVSAGYEFILNKNLDLSEGGTRGCSFTPKGDNKIFLNGYTLSSARATDGGGNLNHIFTFGADSGKLEIVGGTIFDNYRESTQSIFFAGNDFKNEIVLKDCDIYTTSNLITLRQGKGATIDNCKVNYIGTQGATLFQLGEYYNASYTYTNMVLNLIDSEITFKHYTQYNQRLLKINDISDWNTDSYMAAALEKGADKVGHTVNIEGTTINLDFNASFVECTNQFSCINLAESVLNVDKMVHGSSTIDINVIEGVASSTSLDSYNLGKGVASVKSSNYDYYYTSDYATVTWSNGATELWEGGSYPANSDCKYDNVQVVLGGETYTFEAVDKADLGFTILANMTLQTNIKYNFYIPTSAAITAVNIAGVEYAIEGARVVNVDGTECYVFSYEVAPYEAAKGFVVAVSTATHTVAKDFTLAGYKTLVDASAPEATALMNSVYNYVYKAHQYKGVFIKDIGTYNKSYTTTAPEATTTDMSAVSDVVTSAQLNINDDLKFRFNLAQGADITDLAVTVNGKNVEYTLGNGYFEIELRAYEMLDTITITVGGATGTYDLYAYYNYIVTTAGTSWSATGFKAAGANYVSAECFAVKALIEAICDYANAAAAFKA